MIDLLESMIVSILDYKSFKLLMLRLKVEIYICWLVGLALWSWSGRWGFILGGFWMLGIRRIWLLGLLVLL